MKFISRIFVKILIHGRQCI